MTSADFAAAHQRVIARRREREAHAHAQLAQRRQDQSSSPIARLPAPAQRWWSTIISQWNIISGTEGTRPAFRVGQVDSELLDEELLELLKTQVGDAVKYYGAHIRDDYTAEITLALRAVLFKLTLWDKNASYGASLQNLRYTDARDNSLIPGPPKKWQKALYGLASVGGKYAWTKWEDFLVDAEGSYEEPSVKIRTLSRISSMLSTTHSTVALASFLFFLVNGKYRTILDRVFRLKLAPTTNQARREVSFEYLNRQLVWHAFTEFLLFLLPLIGIHRWRRWLARVWRKMQTLLHRGGNETFEDITPGGELGFLPERTCAICYQDQNMADPAGTNIGAISGASSGIVGSAQTDITNPYEAIPCGCVYCYVCLAQRLEAEDGEGWPCLRCGEHVVVCKPWNGDVLEESRSRSSSGKSVTFADDDRGKSAFKELDPMPIEDEKVGEVEAEIEHDAEYHATSPSAKTDDWAGVLDSTLDASQAFVETAQSTSDIKLQDEP